MRGTAPFPALPRAVCLSCDWLPQWCQVLARHRHCRRHAVLYPNSAEQWDGTGLAGAGSRGRAAATRRPCLSRAAVPWRSRASGVWWAGCCRTTAPYTILPADPPLLLLPAASASTGSRAWTLVDKRRAAGEGRAGSSAGTGRKGEGGCRAPWSLPLPPRVASGGVELQLLPVCPPHEACISPHAHGQAPTGAWLRAVPRNQHLWKPHTARHTSYAASAGSVVPSLLLSCGGSQAPAGAGGSGLRRRSGTLTA